MFTLRNEVVAKVESVVEPDKDKAEGEVKSKKTIWWSTTVTTSKTPN